MSHEDQGTGYDSGAAGHELAGRRAKPEVATETLPSFLVCYLGSDKSLTVLSEHSSEVAALVSLKTRDFSNSSLESASFYLLDVTRITLKKSA